MGKLLRLVYGSKLFRLVDSDAALKEGLDQVNKFIAPSSRKHVKVFMGVVGIGKYYSTLKKGFEEMGVASIAVDLSDHSFQYEGTGACNVLVKALLLCRKKLLCKEKSKFSLRVYWKLYQILSCVLFIWAVSKYDVFIFGFASSFVSLYELAILKFIGKKVIYVFHGDDSRPPYLSGVQTRSDTESEIERCIKLTESKKKIVKQIEQYADVIISNPLSSQLHEKPFISFGMIGIPYSYRVNPCQSTLSHNSEIRILHAPSDPEAKGYPRIREAVERLKSKAYKIVFVEIKDKPNAVVMNELERCDFVIDQLYSDVPMAGFATEAALFGKPAIVGSYAREHMERVPMSQPPVHLCHPDELESAIEKLIVDKEYRIQLGRKAKEFVQDNWAAKKVAERYLQLIEGHIPRDWICYPQDIRYTHGACLSEDKVRRVVRAVMEKGGKAALRISDKPELERLVEQFAFSLDR
jgi:glycosyltransferase involved in cell wall biosynthesis